MDVQDNAAVEPPPSSNRIDMDSEDSDSDLDNAHINDKHETSQRLMKRNKHRLMLSSLSKSFKR